MRYFYFGESKSHTKGKGKDDPRVAFEGVNYNALIPVLVEAVQELDAKTDSATISNTLTTTVAAQQAQIADLSKQLADLKNMIADICNSGCAAFQNNGSISQSGGATLYQSVPNPSQGTAVIGYSISLPFSAATIQVADKSGKMIRQFSLPQQQGAGSVTFDGSTVAAGTYSYSLILDGKVFDAKSMVILKD